MKRITLLSALLLFVTATWAAELPSILTGRGTKPGEVQNGMEVVLRCVANNLHDYNFLAGPTVVTEYSEDVVWVLEAVDGETNKFYLKKKNTADNAYIQTPANNTNQTKVSLGAKETAGKFEFRLLTEADQTKFGSSVKVDDTYDPEYTCKIVVTATNGSEAILRDDGDAAFAAGGSDGGTYAGIDGAEWTIWNIYNVSDLDLHEVTVVCQVDLGGDVRTYSTETLTSAVGATVAAPDITYLTLAEGQPSEVEVTENGQTITFTYVQNLPFETTAVADGTFPADAKWYGVDMHSNQTATNGGQYTWQYNADDARLLTPGTPKALSTGLPYEQQFCFDGNIVDGFKIYNRAAGAGMTLESTANNPTLTTSNANNLWKLVKSTAIEGAFWFQQPGGTQYLNHQTENNGAIHVAKYGNADHGSSCRAFPAASFSYNYLSNFTTAPAGAVGGLTDENATAQAVEAVAAYEDNKFNSDYFADALAAVSAAASDTVAFVPGAYYRLVNVGIENGTVTYADGAANLTGNITETDALAEPGTVIRFEPVEGVEGQYHLMVQGRYFGTTRGSTPVVLTDAASAPAYTIAKANVGGRFVIKDVTGGDQAYLNLQSSSRNVLGWNSGEDASRWYIVPATELTVALNSAEGSTWASLYLPFGVSLPDGLKAYTGTRNDEAQTVTLTAIDAVPAETGVILEGSEETYTLTITDVTADVAGNAFTGTNQQLTDIDKAAYYTLGYGSNGLGLYHPNETTLRANVAFLQAGAQGVQGYRLMLDGTTTGIEGAPTAGADKADTWYDLSGRRVTAPTKGVYIQNGRKVVVK